MSRRSAESRSLPLPVTSLALLVVATGCPTADTGGLMNPRMPEDAGGLDSAVRDAGRDAGVPDAGAPDAGCGDCPLGCDEDDPSACARIAPSNAGELWAAAERGLVVGEDESVDTSDCAEILTGGVEHEGLCVVNVQVLTVAAGATLSVRGELPLVFLVDSDAVIDGVIDVSAAGSAPGPGGGTGGRNARLMLEPATGPSPGSAGQRTDMTAGGGGGGGRCGAGGAGGEAGVGPALAAGGAQGGVAGEGPRPLRGGSGGGSGVSVAVPVGSAGGAGGGALQLTAGGSITVTGAILAAGGGGAGGAPGDLLGAGGGGGSGGYVVLEAASVTLAPGGRIDLSGGGGGSGGSALLPGMDGEDGVGAGRPAGGASPGFGSGDGGRGAGDLALNGGAGAPAAVTGGGGGGGAGCLLVRDADGTLGGAPDGVEPPGALTTAGPS